MSSVSFFRCVKGSLLLSHENTYFIVLRRTFFQNVFTFFLIDFILLVCLCAQICFSIFEVRKNLKTTIWKQKKKKRKKNRLSSVRIWSRSWLTSTIHICHWFMPCRNYGDGSEIIKNFMTLCIAVEKEKTIMLIAADRWGWSWSFSMSRESVFRWVVNLFLDKSSVCKEETN